MADTLLSWLSFFAWVQLLAIAVLPLAVRVFRPLPDRGYAFSKFLGLLLLAYSAWLLGMLGWLAHRRASLIALVVVLATCCWGRWGQLVLRERPPRAAVLLLEALFVTAFGAAAAIRAFTPEIVGQEKFMDFAFMHIFVAAERLPAPDPWLSGHAMPYYYFGYFLMASMSELAGVATPIGYNLAVALTLALTILGVAGLVYNAALLPAGIEVGRTKSEAQGGTSANRFASSHSSAVGLERRTASCLGAFVWALLAAAIVAVIGNLEGVLEVLAAQGFGSQTFWHWVAVKGLQPSPVPQGWPPPDFNWFRASRVIPNILPDGITEFPYFSFLLGDLHPHYVALPFDLLIIALALSLVLGGAGAGGWPGLGVAGIALGSLIATNTWDVPTFWLAFAAASLWAIRRQVTAAHTWLWQLGAPFVLALALFSPYFIGYTSQRLGLGLVEVRTPLASLLIVHGPFLLTALALGLWGLVSGRAVAGVLAIRQRLGGPLIAALGLGAGLLVVVETLAAEWTLLVLTALLLLLLPLGISLAGSVDDSSSSPKPRARGPSPAPTAHRLPSAAAPQAVPLAAWFLASLGLLVLLGTELIFIRDAFGTRMNTVFKFHYHAWLLLGLATGLTLLLLWRSGGLVARGVSVALVSGLLGLGGVYPLTATLVKTNAFHGQPTLDGSRFLAERPGGDFPAIAWLRRRAADQPVVVEAVGPDYQEYGRVSTFAGVPSVLGWVGHEVQWRGNSAELVTREGDIDLIYRSEDESVIRALLDRYRVEYVFVGVLERLKYGPEVEARLARVLETAYRSEGATVYRVPRLAQGESG